MDAVLCHRKLKPVKRSDTKLTAAGWSVQYLSRSTFHDARGVAIREFPLKPGRSRRCRLSTLRRWKKPRV